MADPLSITTGVIGLVTQSVKAVQTIQNYVSKYRIADLTIASTRTECSTIRIALLQIQDLLTRDGSHPEIDSGDSFAEYALEEYEAVLSACSTAFSVLNERLEMLNLDGLDQYNRSSFKAKLNAVWNDDEAAILRQNIRGQAAAINLLLSAFQAETSAKTYQLLKESENRRVLKTVSNDVQTLLSKSHRARTITYKTMDNKGSTGSVVGDEVFDFDDLVINSVAYRRAYRQYQSLSTKAPQTPNPEVETLRGKGTNDKSIATAEFLIVHDDDYFDNECERLHRVAQDWVLLFSKFSDMRACRLTREINNEKTIDRIDNTILEGSDPDSYLADRVKRRDVFMSLLMTMIWEFIFTRYFFGMDREQRQKLKSLEKILSEVGPESAVNLWRATTLSLLSKRSAFVEQRDAVTEATCTAIFEILCDILPPPSHLEQKLRRLLAKVLKSAVNLHNEMRMQRAEYIMLPPLQPEYDSNGDLVSKASFRAALMNERSGMSESNEELEGLGAIVRLILFPLVVKKGDDYGVGDEEIVVFPYQAIVVRPLKDRLSSLSLGSGSNVSMVSVAPSEAGFT